MKRSFRGFEFTNFRSTVLLGVAVAFALSGCGSDRGEEGVPPAASILSSPAEQGWTLSYSAECASGLPENCSGAYGFRLSSDGTFELGPAPSGQIITGKIFADDLRRITDERENYLRSSGQALQTGSFSCLKSAVSKGTERVLLRPLHDQSELIRAKGASCDESSSAHAPEEIPMLVSSLREVVEKYAPAKFPSPCLDAVHGLEQDFDDFRRCRQDSDCSWIDSLLTPVESVEDDFEETDHCSYLNPLTVANAFYVVAHQRELVLRRALIGNVCGDELNRKVCGEKPPHQMKNGKHPVCRENRCRMD